MTRAMLFKVRRWSALCMQQALRFLSQRSHVVQVIQVSKVSEEMQRLCKDFVKIAFCYSCSACHVLWSLTVYNVNEFFKTCSFSFIISYWCILVCLHCQPWKDELPCKRRTMIRCDVSCPYGPYGPYFIHGHLLKRAQMTTKGREASRQAWILNIRTFDIIWHSVSMHDPHTPYIYIYTCVII